MVEVKLAHELDPLSLFILTSLGMVLNEAIEQFRRVIDMESGYYLSHWCLGYAYEQRDLFDEAIAAYQKAMALSGDSSSTSGKLAHLFAVLGRTPEALDILNHLKNQAQVRYVSPYDIAGIYAGLGEKEEAFDWLGKALEDHSGSLVWVKVDNTFAKLHSDPLFTDILRLMHLADLALARTLGVNLRKERGQARLPDPEILTPHRQFCAKACPRDSIKASGQLKVGKAGLAPALCFSPKF